MAKCIAIYSRKSKFTGKGESIENQCEMCKQYIEKNYSKEEPIEILIYEDEGFSGKNTERPQLKKLLIDARKKCFSVLVCYRLDRISRNVGDFANLIEELNKLGIDFVSIREAFDTSNPMGRAMMYIASVFAQLERETIAERIRDNMYELSKTGRWLGGTTPTGYTSEGVETCTVDGKKRKVYKLTLIPEEASIITLIYQKYQETGSLTKTEAYLIQHGYVTRNKLYYNRFSIRSILTNPVYLIADEDAYQYMIQQEVDLYSDRRDFDGKHGMMVYNKTLQKEGITHQVKSKKEWIVSVGKHEGIIPGHQWILVQEYLEMNKSKSYKKPRSNQALLSGLLYCGQCGSPMRPKLTRQITASGERSFDYLCTLKEKTKGQVCNERKVQGNDLDQTIALQLFQIPEDIPTLIKELEKHGKNLLTNQKDSESEQVRLQRLRKDCEREVSALVNTLTIASGTTAEQYIMKEIEEYHTKLEQLDIRLLQAIATEQEAHKRYQGLEKELPHILEFSRCFELASVELKRSFLRGVVEKVVWEGTNIHLYLKYAKEPVEDAPLCEDSK